MIGGSGNLATVAHGDTYSQTHFPLHMIGWAGTPRSRHAAAGLLGNTQTCRVRCGASYRLSGGFNDFFFTSDRCQWEICNLMQDHLKLKKLLIDHGRLYRLFKEALMVQRAVTRWAADHQVVWLCPVWSMNFCWELRRPFYSLFYRSYLCFIFLNFFFKLSSMTRHRFISLKMVREHSLSVLTHRLVTPKFFPNFTETSFCSDHHHPISAIIIVLDT